MRELLEIIGALPAGEEQVAATVLEGICAGEKAVYSGGRRVWEEKPGGYFSRLERLPEENSTCGVRRDGETRVFWDVLGQEKRLVICGGGHVSVPVIRIGVMLGWRVTVLEDRPEFANHARAAGAEEVLCMPFGEALEQVEGTTDTYFVVLTRGHRYDQICLEKIVKKEHAYIGMIGSRRRSALVRQNLREKGCDPEVLDQVASPIGLDIGAETPEEIGVAILAEIIGVKNRKRRTCGYPKEIRRAVLGEETQALRKVLVTIVERSGSAPRSIGTKMLVLEDGRLVGTIGGGCAEAAVQKKALQMMREDVRGTRLFPVDMTGEDAEEDGMVCGGRIEVLLERI